MPILKRGELRTTMKVSAKVLQNRLAYRLKGLQTRLAGEARRRNRIFATHAV